MATSDLANELAKPSFHFDNGATEKQVTDVVLTQLDDQSSDISSLATKCLGLVANKVGEERLRALTVSLLETMINAKKEQQRDVASLALKTVITELKPAKARVLAQAAAPHLLEGLRSASPDVASNSLDSLIEIASRHGAALPNIDTLRDALIPELDASRAGIRKRAIHCLALLASYLPTPSLDSLCEAIFTRLEMSTGTTSTNKEQARSYIQALGALSKSVGFKLGPHMSRAVPLVLARLKSADEGDDELMELALVAVESFVQRCPSDTRPFLDELTTACLQFLKFDPNYAADDDDDEEMAGGEESEVDEDFEDEDEEVYSDEEDGSWKVRRAAAKLAAALVSQYPEVLLNTYRQVAPALVKKFNEREEAVRPDIYQSYNDLTRAVGAAARRGDAAAQAALGADIPSVLRALAKQLRGKSTKTKSLALKSLQELVRAAPAAVVSGLGDVVPGVKSALEDKSTGASALKIDALAFLNAALAASPPATFQSHAAALAPAVFTAAADRYYAVSAEALRACEQFVHVLRPQCPEPVHAQLASLVAPLFDVAAGRLAAQDLSLEVKEAAISCAAAAVAELGDVLEGDTEKVGTLAEEFAAMPRGSRGRATKRAKTEKGAKATASSPSENAPVGGGSGVHPSNKISEVRLIEESLLLPLSLPWVTRLRVFVFLLILWLVHTYLHCRPQGGGYTQGFFLHFFFLRQFFYHHYFPSLILLKLRLKILMNIIIISTGFGCSFGSFEE
jgi:cullin-associated NEDD8-dissociated protein 1